MGTTPRKGAVWASLLCSLLLTGPLSAQDMEGFGSKNRGRGIKRPSRPALHCVEFEEFATGEIIGTSVLPLGPVVFSGFNPSLGNTNASIIFDSANPTGTDFDLGTPNQDFGGPGIGEAGGSGSPFANTEPKGKVLIIAENLLDANNDGLIDDPDDADVVGSRIDVDFSGTGPVHAESVFFIDGEALDRPPSTIDFFAPGGALITTIEIVPPGNNGVILTTLDVDNVERMVFTLNGSTAIDDICVREFIDCNGNGVQDFKDIEDGTSNDCNDNWIPDECEPDCDVDGIPDDCEPDCDSDGTPDDCEPDCDSDGLPDDCEPDCDNDGTPDDCEEDCDDDGVPDDCDGPDCNSNGIPDNCDIDSGTSNDCNSNGTPDECEPDCDNDGIPDSCEPDCDNDGSPDDCEPDCDSDGIPDDCEPDCDSDGTPDDCEPDCDSDGTPDDCEPDCDSDGTPDDCEPDCDMDGTPDDCEPDGDMDGTPDDCEECPPAEHPCDLGCYALSDNGGGLSPPDYGLRLDNLFGPGSGNYTFSFEQPGTGGMLCYDDLAGVLTISGTGFGGLDIGGGYDPAMTSFITVNFVYTGVFCGGDKLIAPDDSLAYGTLVWEVTGEIFQLYGQSDGNGRFGMLNSNNTWAGWISFDPNSNSGGTQDWVLSLEALSECPEPPDCDHDGVPDDMEEDCDSDGVPDDCEPDSNDNGVPDDCDICATNLDAGPNDPCVTSSEPERAFWFENAFDAGADKRYAWETVGTFAESADGTATLTGRIVNIGDPTRIFDVALVFADRVEPGDANYPPVGSPRLVNFPAGGGGDDDDDDDDDDGGGGPPPCYIFDGGFADPDTWRYYETIGGFLTGAGVMEGAVLGISRRGEAFQIGVAANLKNGNFGASGWTTHTILSQPTSGPTLGGSLGDINTDITNCP